MNKKIWIIAGAVVFIAVVIFLLIYNFSNQDDNKKYQVKRAELTPIKEQMKVLVKRYEKDLFSISIDSLSEGVQKLYGKYPEALIQKDIWLNSEMINSLKAFLTDPVIQEIYEETVKIYPNSDELTAQLTDALSYYQYYYPEASIPQFYTLVSGIDLENPPVFLLNDDILIHLDHYLGANYTVYTQIGIPKYICERMDKRYLAIDCFKKAIVNRHLPDKKESTLLDYMILEGKKLYFTELMFPDVPENDIIGYEKMKYEWAEKYQPEVWNHIINQDELFSKSDKVITTYIGESPFTRAFNNESPGRIGAFIGWKLVKSYMKNNPDVTLNQLMNNTDSKEILNRSRYKPGIK